MNRIESRSPRLAVMVTTCTSSTVGWHGSMRQFAGHGSPGPTSVLSQLSGAVTTSLPQIVQKFVQPSSGSVFPSSHSSPGSRKALPHDAGIVVELVLLVVVTSVDDDVVGVTIVD